MVGTRVSASPSASEPPTALTSNLNDKCSAALQGELMLVGYFGLTLPQRRSLKN
uniref:Uncharacterized protein n=1 Tax=Utricularia reniformis TaxID=192314 RepID=A0A1Y0B3K1_9LAMI|nr:hypothetical protein AEK19_MT1784 [Utricularia reniformis]ART31957.1 hypothetical protein AEK19_MT1784 [Utricularia reniformis]